MRLIERFFGQVLYLAGMAIFWTFVFSLFYAIVRQARGY